MSHETRPRSRDGLRRCRWALRATARSRGSLGRLLWVETLRSQEGEQRELVGVAAPRLGVVGDEHLPGRAGYCELGPTQRQLPDVWVLQPFGRGLACLHVVPPPEVPEALAGKRQLADELDDPRLVDGVPDRGTEAGDETGGCQVPVGVQRPLGRVEVVAPTMLTRAAVPGMVDRGTGTIVNVAGMIAFSGPAPSSQMPRRAVYAGTLAHTVAMSQTLSAELEGTGVRVQVVCPGVVATEFHTVQGMDLSAVPRMTAEDVVTGSLRGLDLGEVVCAPGVEDASLLQKVFDADLAAFSAQSPQLAQRYRAG